ncbi:hypothetical protein ABFV05_020199 [Capra hircus]
MSGRDSRSQPGLLKQGADFLTSGSQTGDFAYGARTQGLQEPGGDGGGLRSVFEVTGVPGVKGTDHKEERPCNTQEQPSRKTSQRSPFSLYHTPTGHKTPSHHACGPDE